ncbi:hypothetical protein Daus18300_004368 [Diaporthe australafricana]|uniref:Uncharacterized protein n=1 Tax=Diaporthe australafricana TaxID=127596 RepID=A0ABR3X9W5_9PEZI
MTLSCPSPQFARPNDRGNNFFYKLHLRNPQIQPVNMQLTTLLVLATSAAAGLAQSCTYETANYLSVCQQGNNLFCSGNTNICTAGTTDTFDDTATKANEHSCAGLSRGDSCVQTVACC